MGMMQRRRARVDFQPFFSRTVSALRFIIRLAPLGSLAQRGTRPHLSSRSCRAPSGEAVTTRMSLAGATFQLGWWPSTPRGSARNCSSRNWSWLVELNRPHMPLPYPTDRTAERPAGVSRAAAGPARRPTSRPREGEEESAPHRQDVLLEGLALEAGLDGQESPGQALLVADEGQPLVEPAGGVEAAGEVEAAAQDAAAGRLGGARVGHADMGVQGDPPAGRVVGVAGVVGLAVLAERGPGGLVAADDLLLLVQGGAVPELDEHADDADRLVAAPDRPGRLAVVGPDPDQLVHQALVGDVEVGGAVLEAEQVAVAGLAGHGPGVGAVVAVEHPVQDQ